MLHSWWSKLFHNCSAHSARRKPGRHRRAGSRPSVEALEHRTLLSAISLVSDLAPGAHDSMSLTTDPPVNVNGTVFFMADDGVHGPEL